MSRPGDQNALAVKCGAALAVCAHSLSAAVEHDAVIRVYDATDNIIETHEHIGDFKDA